MKIDRKLSSDINITNPKNAELFFDINDNTLAVKTIDGQFNIKQEADDVYYQKLKNAIKDDELDMVYSGAVGVLYINQTEYAEIKLCGANAYKLSDGTIYVDKQKNDEITHTYKSGTSTDEFAGTGDSNGYSNTPEQCQIFYVIYYFEYNESSGESISRTEADTTAIIIKNMDFSNISDIDGICFNHSFYAFADLTIELINSNIVLNNRSPLYKIGGDLLNDYFENVTFKNFTFLNQCKFQDNYLEITFKNCNWLNVTDYSDIFLDNWGLQDINGFPNTSKRN